MNSGDVTIQSIREAVRSLPPVPIIYGISFSPYAYANISPGVLEPDRYSRIPILVDPRQEEDSQVFMDESSWQKRVKEQQAHDKAMAALRDI